MRLLTSLASLIVIFGIPSCTSEASSPVGVYSVTVDTTGMPEEAAAMMSQMMTSGELHLNADQTWSVTTAMELMGQKQTSTTKGTWVLEGNEIVMTATETDGEETVDSKPTRSVYADGAFTVELEEGEQSLKLHMKKKDS